MSVTIRGLDEKPFEDFDVEVDLDVASILDQTILALCVHREKRDLSKKVLKLILIHFFTSLGGWLMGVET